VGCSAKGGGEGGGGGGGGEGVGGGGEEDEEEDCLSEQYRPRNLSIHWRDDSLYYDFGILLQATGPLQVHRILQT